MNSSKYTIGIYGIQDTVDFEYPQYVHDHSIAIMHMGKIIHHIQQERISRRKYDNSLHKSLYSILKEKKLLNIEADVVFVDNIIGRAFISSEGNIRFEAPVNNDLSKSYEAGNLFWLDKHSKGYILNHELAHLYSCVPFFGDFNEDSLLIHFDGGASKSNFSAWHYKSKELKLIDYNWNLKKLSSFFNANALTFGIIGANIKEQNSVPGKIMGLAPYGTYSPEIEKWLIGNEYFANIWKSKKAFYEKVKNDWGIELKHLDQKNTFIQDIVATFHSIFERETILEIERLKLKTKANYLYFTGGSALNIKLNTKLVNTLGFDEVFIPPCTNDSGLALGAAACIELAKGHKIRQHSPYLNNWNIENYETSYDIETIKKVAALIQENKVIGVCNGHGEIGPRALGNRSILALANSKELSKRVSMDIKKREWYRPIAPIMLHKNAAYFTGLQKINHLAKYMLLDFNILKEHRKELHGVIHVDGTSRIQTINDQTENPFMWDLLQYLDQNHNVKALINTSFNSQGEPIIHSEDDAFKSAKRMKLDAVVLNGKLHFINE